MSIFEDSPEYKKRVQTDYTLPNVTLKDIHAAVPKELWKKNTIKGVGFLLRDALFCCTFYKAATFIDPLAENLKAANFNPWAVFLIRWSLWATYWFFQSMVGGGLFVLGHDAGHGSLSEYQLVNHTIGFLAHTAIFAPYYAWRHSHHLHHKSTGSMERDENYVPKTRSELGLAPEKLMKRRDYQEIFEEAPIYTILRMLLMQSVGWVVYLTVNSLGSPMYPKGTGHWLPSSPLFREADRLPVMFNNIGLGIWGSILAYWAYNTSFATFTKYYLIPYLLTNNWIVMFTFLHHTDPTVPHFRKDTWTFLRGATTTIDRPLMGWMGRFFLHNISHDHVSHHFFSSIPFWHGPVLSAHVSKVLGDSYNRDTTNGFRALYRSFTQCLFVEDEGDIVFYKGTDGMRVRKVAGEAEL